REDVPAEGQTASQRAARLFKTCDDVVAQETDYVPRIRGYMHDANLHWPQHPATRDHSAVDVLSSMLQISDKWGWPCFFEFYTRGSSDSFELTVHPTVHLEQFKYNAVKLGVGITSSSEIETVANNRQYFQLILHLVATKEEVLELVIGWLCVQYTSWFANRELIANFYGYPENADLRHRRICLAFTISLTGIALVVPFVQGVYTEPVRKDAWGITRAVRRTVYQTLNEATYPWHEISSVFRFLDIAVVHDLEARFAHFPNMEVSFVKNLRDATKANRLTNLDSIGKMDPSWILADDLYQALSLGDRADYVLKPSILTPPHVPRGRAYGAPHGHLRCRTGQGHHQGLRRASTPGPHDNGHRRLPGLHTCRNERRGKFRTIISHMRVVCAYQTSVLARMNCSSKEQSYHERGLPDLTTEWIARLEDSVMTAAALDVALAVLKQSPSFDDDRLGDVPLTARQLFYVIHCYTYCGDEYGQFSCNQPLRHKADFADAFSCAPRSDMRAARPVQGLLTPRTPLVLCPLCVRYFATHYISDVFYIAFHFRLYEPPMFSRH
ncbi:hypothetical protein MRX96_049005, partial [Rhipicephalus microplus]